MEDRHWSATSEGKTRARILLVAPQPVYEDRGTPIAISLVTRALTELDVEVEVLTYPLGQDIDLADVTLNRGANPLRLSHVPIGFSIRKVVLDLGLIPKLIRLVNRGSYDCIIAVEEAIFLSLIIGRWKGIPVLYDMQSCIPEELSKHPVLGLRPVQAILKRLESWALTRAQTVVCSSGLESYVASRAPETTVFEWRFPAESVPVSASEATAIRREFDIAPEASVVVYTGNDSPYQGTALLIEAAALVHDQMPEVVFLLVGFPETSRVLRTKSSERLVSSGALRVISRQPRAKVFLVLGAAQILISPRVAGKNVPLKIFDYLATGKPIVATRDYHQPVIGDKCALLVEASPEGLANGVIRLLQDPDLARSLGDNALELARRKLDWVSFRDRVEAVLVATNQVPRGAIVE